MRLVFSPMPENRLLRRQGHDLLPATLGEALGAVIDDPTLRPTELALNQQRIGQEAEAETAPRSWEALPGDTTFQTVRDDDDPGHKFARAAAPRRRETPDDLVDAEILNAEFGDLDLAFERPTSRRMAEILAEGKREELIRQDILRRGPHGIVPTALSFGAAFLGAAVDPLNVAASFIPVVGEARFAALTARIGKHAARLSRGFIEGAVGNAMIEPGVALMARSQQLDYEMSDALLNVALGGFLGGGLHVGAGKVGDMLSRMPAPLREQALRAAIAQAVEGRRIDIEALVGGPSFRARMMETTAFPATPRGVHFLDPLTETPEDVIRSLAREGVGAPAIEGEFAPLRDWGDAAVVPATPRTRRLEAGAAKAVERETAARENVDRLFETRARIGAEIEALQRERRDINTQDGGGVALRDGAGRKVAAANARLDEIDKELAHAVEALDRAAEMARIAEFRATEAADVAALKAGEFDARVAWGDVRPAADLPRYARWTAKRGGKTDLPRFLFDIGRMETETLMSVARVFPDFREATGRRVMMSNQVVDKAYRNAPKIADRLIRDLVDVLESPREILPSLTDDGRVLFVSKIKGEGRKAKASVAVIEVTRRGDGFEIVSVHRVPDRSLAKARKRLREKVDALFGKQGAGGAARPSYGESQTGTPAAAASVQPDFPTVGTDQMIPHVGENRNQGLSREMRETISRIAREQASPESDALADFVAAARAQEVIEKLPGDADTSAAEAELRFAREEIEELRSGGLLTEDDERTIRELAVMTEQALSFGRAAKAAARCAARRAG